MRILVDRFILEGGLKEKIEDVKEEVDHDVSGSANMLKLDVETAEDDIHKVLAEVGIAE